jgi:hypothetical protein
MKLTLKQTEDLRGMHDIQGDHGNWNYDEYMRGMYNGMELMLSTMENRVPEFRDAPGVYLCDIPTEAE